MGSVTLWLHYRILSLRCELTLLITTQILLLLGLKDKPEPPATEETDQADEGVDNAENNDKPEKENEPLPEFGQYLYFLFCPTLIYRDQYPMLVLKNTVVCPVFVDKPHSSICNFQF